MKAPASLKPANSATKASDDPSIAFRYDAKARLFAAARRVATRDGVRALTIAAIAEEADRAPGTVGRYGIDMYIEHIVDYCFVPLVGLFERQRKCSGNEHGGLERTIDVLLRMEPDVPALIMQALALIITRSSSQAGTSSYSLRVRFREAREDAEQTIARLLAQDVGCSGADTREQASWLIRYYLDRCARAFDTP